MKSEWLDLWFKSILNGHNIKRKKGTLMSISCIKSDHELLDVKTFLCSEMNWPISTQELLELGR